MKIADCFRRTKLTLKPDLSLLTFYPDGRLEDRWLLSARQHNFEFRPNVAHVFYQDCQLEKRWFLSARQHNFDSDLNLLMFYQDGRLEDR